MFMQMVFSKVHPACRWLKSCILGRKVIYVRCINCSYNNVANGIRLLDKKKQFLFQQEKFHASKSFWKICALNQIMPINRNRTRNRAKSVSEDCNFPCLVLITLSGQACANLQAHLSIRCLLALACWLICFLWEVTSSFHFYTTKLRHCWSSNGKRASRVGDTLIFFLHT